MDRRRIILLLSLAVGACSGRYMDLSAAQLDPDTAFLVQRAQLGDKSAQFELGQRFAAGKGVPRDCKKALELTRRAASTTGGTLWVYSPPVTQGGRGQVIPIDRGPVQPGLAAATAALANEAVCRED
jgi:hypothetical protein